MLTGGVALFENFFFSKGVSWLAIPQRLLPQLRFVLILFSDYSYFER